MQLWCSSVKHSWQLVSALSTQKVNSSSSASAKCLPRPSGCCPDTVSVSAAFSSGLSRDGSKKLFNLWSQSSGPLSVTESWQPLPTHPTHPASSAATGPPAMRANSPVLRLPRPFGGQWEWQPGPGTVGHIPRAALTGTARHNHGRAWRALLEGEASPPFSPRPCLHPACGRLGRQLRVRLSKGHIQKEELTGVADMKSHERRSQRCLAPSVGCWWAFPCGRERGAVRVRH